MSADSEQTKELNTVTVWCSVAHCESSLTPLSVFGWKCFMCVVWAECEKPRPFDTLSLHKAGDTQRRPKMSLFNPLKSHECLTFSQPHSDGFIRIFIIATSGWPPCVRVLTPPHTHTHTHTLHFQGHVVNVSDWNWALNGQQRGAQISQAAAATALFSVASDQIRGQISAHTLFTSSPTHTHTVCTVAPDRFSGTNLSSMLHRHHHTPPTHPHCTLYSMCSQSHTYKRSKKETKWSKCAKYF